MNGAIPEGYPPLLSEFANLFHARLAQCLPEETARRLALALTDDLAQIYEGCQLYIPKRDGLARAHRDAALARAFDGHNHAALARRYGLTVTQVYDILARKRLGMKKLSTGDPA